MKRIYDCGDLLDGYGEPETWPHGLLEYVIEIADEYYIAHERAIIEFGTPEEVSTQLILLESKKGKA